MSYTYVNVRPSTALIVETRYDFSDDLRNLADKETVKVKPDSIDGSCASLGSNVGLDGVSAPQDKAYILGYEALRVLQTKDDIMHCLGQLVKVGAALKVLWEGQQLAITDDMAKDFYDSHFTQPQQLSFSEIKATLDQLMRALGSFAQNGQPPSAEDTATLTKLFVGNVSLTDSTYSHKFRGDALPTGFPAIINFLISKGYYHYGCFAQNTDQTGQYATSVNSIFLAMKAPPNESTGKKSETLAIHPIFADSVHTIQTLDVSDNQDWITNVLADRTKVFDCNGFEVK
jgi:hypothetical protein